MPTKQRVLIRDKVLMKYIHDLLTRLSKSDKVVVEQSGASIG